MRNLLRDFATDLRDRQRVAIAISRGQASRALRTVDLRHPASWEFSGFSQNGEDGILEVLRSQLAAPARTFLEIGAADGVQNNTSWLLVVERWLGLMVEGSDPLSAKCRRLLDGYSIGSRFEARMVTSANAPALLPLSPAKTIDVFSLDIDGIDWHVATALFGAGLRPRIAVVEYNSVFGPERRVTVPDAPVFDFRSAHPTQLYYGVSLAAWRHFFESRGYRFVTVDSHGVNAFFADPAAFQPGFLDSVVPLAWAENRYQTVKTGASGEAQFRLIAGMPLQDA